MSDDVRIERDLLGEVAVPAGSLHGAHTERALENFPLAERPVHAELARAYGVVKLACARTNRALGAWAGKAWRVGVMGQSATPQHVLTCIGALESALIAAGARIPAGAGVRAARTALGEG